MTRTERSIFPKAISKDRSESKSGMDKSLRKRGAGTHNWGSLADEASLEYDAWDDEEADMQRGKTPHPNLACMALIVVVHQIVRISPSLRGEPVPPLMRIETMPVNSDSELSARMVSDTDVMVDLELTPNVDRH